METAALQSSTQSHRIWQDQSRQEKILEIQELIVSPYWQHLSPIHRRKWLQQLEELHNA